MKPVRILIADSQYLTRAGLSRLIEGQEELLLVGEAQNSGQLFEKLPELKPDLVILDYHQPGKFSLEDIGKLQQAIPQPQLIVITSDTNKDNIFQALQLGVTCFLTKSCSQREIQNAIYATHREEKFFCNTILDIILQKQVHQVPDQEPDCEPSILTARETEIIRLVAGGMSTKNIANTLFLSTHTVYTHRKNIMKKLGINSASEMILYAMQSGMVGSN
ncbi:MAG: response regulator transcription factor [Bacteroidia bacterium]|nr:response regulator transcription factor [Bacteroidia bacterium]